MRCAELETFAEERPNVLASLPSRSRRLCLPPSDCTSFNNLEHPRNILMQLGLAVPHSTGGYR